jgi:flagellar protein FlbD
MIQLTRLNNQPLVVNSDLIKCVENAPDTVLTLATGEKIIVCETTEQVLDNSTPGGRAHNRRVDMVILNPVLNERSAILPPGPAVNPLSSPATSNPTPSSGARPQALNQLGVAARAYVDRFVSCPDTQLIPFQKMCVNDHASTCGRAR